MTFSFKSLFSSYKSLTASLRFYSSSCVSTLWVCSDYSCSCRSLTLVVNDSDSLLSPSHRFRS